MRTVFIAAGLAAFSLSVSASAQESQSPPLHTKPYYMQHRSVRDATLGWCHEDESRSVLWDCRNAEAAGNERIISRKVTDPLMDPQFWRENPMVRDGVLRICAHPTEADGMYLPYCRVAAAGVGR